MLSKKTCGLAMAQCLRASPNGCYEHSRSHPNTDGKTKNARRHARRKAKAKKQRRIKNWEASERPCRCDTEHICLKHKEIIDVDTFQVWTERDLPKFVTERRVDRLVTECTLDETDLEKWAGDLGVEIGPVCPAHERLEVLQTLWTYRHLFAEGGAEGGARLGPPTDLIQHRTLIKQGTPIYRAAPRRLSPDKEWWLRKFVTEGLENGMFERTIVANGQLSRWGANANLVKREGKDTPRLTFDYHYVWEEPLGNQMQLSAAAHDFLSHPSHNCFAQFDLKDAYWTVPIHPDDRAFLAFSISGIGQLQPTRMAQGARSSSFTMNELGNLTLGPIPPPRPEPSFLHSAKPDELPQMTFYADDMLPAHSCWRDHWYFIKNHLLPRLLWARLRLSPSKVKLGMDKILALGEMHMAGGLVAPKPERVRKILDWPVPQTATEVREFTGTVLSARPWMKNYTEICRPLTRLTGNKVEWQWGEAEQLSFITMKNLAATGVMKHGWDPALPLEAFSDASKRGGGFFVRQLQNGRWVPILYDSFAFTATERNYDTYKRELKAIVYFLCKHRHMFMGPKTSTVWTDHKPLVGFLTSDTHEDIFFRWVEKLRPLNIKLAWIEGKRNQAADGLSRTIFEDDCRATERTRVLLEEVEKHDEDGKREWFWKTGKGGYQDLLKRLTKEDEKIEAEAKSVAVVIGWKPFTAPEREAEGDGLDRWDPSCRVMEAKATKVRDTGKRVSGKKRTPLMYMTESGCSNCGAVTRRYYGKAAWKLCSTCCNVRNEEVSRGVDTEIDESWREMARRRKTRHLAEKRVICSNCGHSAPQYYPLVKWKLCFPCSKARKREREKGVDTEVDQGWRKMAKPLYPKGEEWRMDPPPKDPALECSNCQRIVATLQDQLCYSCVKIRNEEDRKGVDTAVDETWREIGRRAGRPQNEGAGWATPNQCLKAHKHCDTTACRHYCCRARHFTRDMAARELERLPGLPMRTGFNSGRTDRCPKDHAGCDRAKCAHICCRQLHAACIEKHTGDHSGVCDPGTCDHECCKLWVQWTLRGAWLQGAEALKFQRESAIQTGWRIRPATWELRQAAFDELGIELEKRHEHVKLLACEEHVNRSDLLAAINEWKATVEVMAGLRRENRLAIPKGGVAEKFLGAKGGNASPPRLESGSDDDAASSRVGRDDGSREAFREEGAAGTAGEGGSWPTAWDPALRGYDIQDDSRSEVFSLAPTERTSQTARTARTLRPRREAHMAIVQAVVNSVEVEGRVDYDVLNEEWYGDVTRYCRDQVVPQDWVPSHQHKLKRQAKKYRWDEKREALYRVVDGVKLPCVHPRDVPQILATTHDRAGHFAVETVARKIRGRLWWPTLVRDVFEYVDSCVKCALWADYHDAEPLLSLDSLYPYELVQMDLMVGLPKSHRGNTACLVMVCCFSDHVAVKPVADKSGPVVARAMAEVFDAMVAPAVLSTDAGTENIAKETQEELRKRGVFHTVAPARSHRTTGTVESTIKILRAVTNKEGVFFVNSQGRKFVDRREWDDAVQEGAASANARHVPHMGYSPNEVVFGYQPDELRDMQHSYPTERREAIISMVMVQAGQATGGREGRAVAREDIRSSVRIGKERAREARMERANRSREGGRNSWLVPGDLVLAPNGDPTAVRSGDEPKWIGPFRIVKEAGEHGKALLLEEVSSGKQLVRHRGVLQGLRARPHRLRVAGDPVEWS